MNDERGRLQIPFEVRHDALDALRLQQQCVDFEIKMEAPHIHVGCPDRGDLAVDDEQLGMDEAFFILVNLDARL
ncbi:hypothetical protein D3C72_2087390 [compost metagenome]